MREIKYRGKPINESGLWEYGYYTYEEGKHVIRIKDDDYYLNGSPVAVHEKSVGQFTGIKNCDTREEMYEGDVVKGHWWENGKKHRHIGVITYIMNTFVVRGVKQYRGYDDYQLNPTYEIIGNVYENPEIIK